MKKTNGEIKIENGVPLPPIHRGRGEIINALRKMDIGDSFYTAKAWSMYNVAARAGITITVRREGKGFRIWRTA